MELYPIKFEPILIDKIWGGSKLKKKLGKEKASNTCGESWEISSIEGHVSEVKNGFLKGNDLNDLLEVYMADLIGEVIYEKFGNEFPLLFKFIDASDVLSIQVHPDDNLAKNRHNAYGKTEMWYVLDADKDAELIIGFKKTINKEIYLQSLNNDELTTILNTEKVKAGSSFYIPAGRVHAIGKGILLAEIQQTSDITYRIYDWNRKSKNGEERELHTDLAVDAIDYAYHKKLNIEYDVKKNDASTLVDSKYFTTNFLFLDKKIETDYSILDSFIVYMCLEGEFMVELDNGTKELIKKGESVLIPAIAEQVSLTPIIETKILEVFIKPDKLKK